MTIKERLALLKAGYSKDEINAMIDEEKTPVEQTEEQTESKTDVPDFMAAVTALAEEVKGMKKAMQKENLKNTEIDGTETTKDQVDKILQSIINPIEEKE